MVRGPTPPGTGVSAPATSATAGCTSPTTTDPRRAKSAWRVDPSGNAQWAANGVPIVAGNRDGSVDALADGVLGTLIDPDDRTALSHALVAAIHRGRSRSQIGGVERFAFPNFATHVDDLVRTHLH